MMAVRGWLVVAGVSRPAGVGEWGLGLTQLGTPDEKWTISVFMKE